MPMIEKSYLIYGNPVTVTTDLEDVIGLVDDIIGFFSAVAADEKAGPIRISILKSDSQSIEKVTEELDGIEQLFAFDRLTGYRVGERLILVDGYSAAVCYPGKGIADIYLNLKTIEIRRFFSFIFFYIMLVEMLRYRGLYYVHASCVAVGDKGVLISGDTGVGKSTLCITLLREGCKYLSDDGVLLKDEGDNVRILSLPGDFHIDPAISERFEELEKVKNARKYGNGPKRSFRAEDVYPEQFVLEAKQGFILFPEITGEEKSALVPLGRAEALAKLIPSSLLVMMDKDIAPMHLAALKKIVEKSKSYRMKSGADLIKSPHSVVSMIKKELFGEC